MNKLQLKELIKAELHDIKKHYKNGTLYEYFSENVYGIDYEVMTLDLSSYSYADLYKEKIYAHTFGGDKLSIAIPSEICQEIIFILKEVYQ